MKNKLDTLTDIDLYNYAYEMSHNEFELIFFDF